MRKKYIALCYMLLITLLVCGSMTAFAAEPSASQTVTPKAAPVSMDACEVTLQQTVCNYTKGGQTPAVTVKYKGKELSEGADYYVTYTNNINIGTAKVNVVGLGGYTGKKSVDFQIVFGTPTVNAVGTSYNKIKISYGKVANAKGYEIYRSTRQKSGYKKIKAYTSSKKITYNDTKAKYGTTYYYKVRAYYKSKGKKIYSAYSEPVSAQTKSIAIPTLKSAKYKSSTSAKVSWSKVKGAQGYYVYKSTAEDGSYSLAKKVGSGTSSATISSLGKNKVYYFKIKAYRKGSSKVFTAFSKIAKETGFPISTASSTNKYVNVKDARLKELFPKGVPTTATQMQQYLAYIQVPIYQGDDQDGNPIIGQHKLTVHKALVDKYQQAFAAMVAIKFPVRAADTAAYCWRSMATSSSRSHHSYGCAIDINSSSNPMIQNGKYITDGKYKPGVDPYSITPAVVDIWKSVGFFWGGEWNSSKDYMHMSYTNC